MPKIADIQETPNPNAVKFILKEPVSHGTSHSFKTREDQAGNELSTSLFDAPTCWAIAPMGTQVRAGSRFMVASYKG